MTTPESLETKTRMLLNDAYQYGLEAKDFDAETANVALNDLNRKLLTAFSEAMDYVIGEKDLHVETEGHSAQHRLWARNALRAEQCARKSEVLKGNI